MTISRLAIIPARGGSKRIPRKNIKEFCGLPIISYPLMELQKSELFDEIHVSTEDTEIYNLVKKIGFDPNFYRIKELSGDHVATLPVLRYVVAEFNKRKRSFDEIWLITPCSPLIVSMDLINASKVFSMNKSQNPLLAVAELPIPLEWAFSIDRKNLLVPIKSGAFAKRSQDLEKSYYDSGTFAIFSNEMIINSEGPGVNESFIAYQLPKKRAIDIDDLDDWELAEAVYLGSKLRKS